MKIESLIDRSREFEGVVSQKSGELGFLCDRIIGVSSPNVLKNMLIICYCHKRTPLTVIMKQLKLMF